MPGARGYLRSRAAATEAVRASVGRVRDRPDQPIRRPVSRRRCRSATPSTKVTPAAAPPSSELPQPAEPPRPGRHPRHRRAAAEQPDQRQQPPRATARWRPADTAARAAARPARRRRTRSPPPPAATAGRPGSTPSSSRAWISSACSGSADSCRATSCGQLGLHAARHVQLRPARAARPRGGGAARSAPRPARPRPARAARPPRCTRPPPSRRRRPPARPGPVTTIVAASDVAAGHTGHQREVGDQAVHRAEHRRAAASRR